MRGPIGSVTVRNWARSLKPNSIVLDLGCGTGIPVTKILKEEGLDVYAIDASSKLIKTFQQNFPDIPVSCEPAEQSRFFNKTFDGIIAIGLLFLLEENAQLTLIKNMAASLNPDGQLLFTSPKQKVEWKDVLTNQRSRSLGAEQYQTILKAAGLTLTEEQQDEGGNYYFTAKK